MTLCCLLDAPSLLSSVHLGIILVYSVERPASLSVLKHLLPKVPPNTPKLIIAMTTTKSINDKKWLLEGLELARKWGTQFSTNNGEELPGQEGGILGMHWLSDFLSSTLSGFFPYNRQLC